MKVTFALLFALLAVVAIVSSASVSFTRPSRVLRHWAVQERVHASTMLRFVFAVKQSNVAELEKVLFAVSEPDSPLYGKHLSVDAINALVAPRSADVETVLAFVRPHAHSVTVSASGDFVTCEMTAARAESLLAAEFFYHKHISSGIRLARTVSYSLPDHVAQCVDFVGGTTRLPKVRSAIVRAPGAHVEITPRVLRDRYNVSGIEGKSGNNSQAVAQFLEQHYSPLDLQEFFTILDPVQIGRTVAKEVGPNHIPSGTEASLDIEYIMGVGAHIPTWFWSTAGLHDNQEPFLDWIMLVGNTTDVPLLHSVSYGDDEDTVDIAYATRINEEFMELGARGISILFASGDDGVGGDDSNGCTHFVPNFPTSSPYVTSVGGTAFDSLLSERKEVVNGLSGGGFSNYFGQPEYQVAAVNEYFQVAKNLPAASYYNRTGRGYPDVSAISDGYTVVCNLIPLPGVAGTSCSTPVVSAVFSLVNDLRLQNGMPALGFLNPFIYKAAATPGAFFDVTEGANPNCGTDGFWAAPGWDPSSGVGSPNYTILSKLALQYAKAH